MAVKIFLRVVLSGLAATWGSLALAQKAQEETELLRSGHAKEAYERLLGEEAAQAGQVDFDYLLGRAALDAGDAAKATLVFERVLTVAPNHAGARLDMGRAYFALGDFERARAEFAAVQALDPPPAARATIDEYLAAMENRPRQARSAASAYVEAGVGHDSNVTIGPRSATVMLPVFGLSFTLSDGARAKGDSYHAVNAGGEVVHQLDGQRAVFAGADLRFRNYHKVDAFDQLSGEVRGGVIWNRAEGIYRAYASFNDFRLGDERYREVTTLGGDWRHALDARHQLAVFGQWSAIRHVQRAMQASDYDQYLFGAGWTLLPAATGGLMLSGAVFGGGEVEQERRSDGNKLLAGVRGGAQYGPRADTDVFAGVSWQYGRYDRTNALYGERRRDNQFDLNLGAAWRFAPSWSLRPTVTWTQNESNTSINKYQRGEASVFVRRDF